MQGERNLLKQGLIGECFGKLQARLPLLLPQL